MDDEVCIGNVLDEIGPKTPSNKSTITLSSDKKNILSDSKIIFSIDDDVIYDFMIGQAGLCDSSNIDNNSSRREYCSDIATYKDIKLKGFAPSFVILWSITPFSQSKNNIWCAKIFLSLRSFRKMSRRISAVCPLDEAVQCICSTADSSHNPHCRRVRR